MRQEITIVFLVSAELRWVHFLSLSGAPKLATDLNGGDKLKNGMDCREKHYDLGNMAHFLVSGVVVALLAIKIDEKA